MRNSKFIFKLGIIILTFIFTAAVWGTNQLRVKSYHLDVGFYPDAKMDFAGLIEVMEGKRPGWNKEDSTAIYPHMKGRAG